MNRYHPISKPRVTLRSIIIGLFLIPVNTYWVLESEAVWGVVHATVLSLFFNVIFTLFVLSVLNLALRKWLPSVAFNTGELLTIYVMLCIATSLYGHDMMQTLVPLMNYGHWFATPENGWEDLFWGRLPGWLMMTDNEVATGYHEGDTNLYDSTIIKAWGTPILFWTGFIMVLYFTMICIVTLIRRRWIEEEKLSYPIIQLPLEMTVNSARFFRNRLMWIGFGISAGLDMVHGLHRFFPFVPDFVTKYNLAPFFAQKPWNAIGWLPICFYPFVIGLAYFMPLDLSLSCWFFFWLAKAERVMAQVMGWNNLHLDERSAGAWIGVGIIAIWLSRKYLADVIRQIFTRQSPLDETTEPMSYRTAFIFLIVCFVLLFGFCYQAGMTPWVIIVFYALFFIMGLAITRVRAELGPPYHEVIFVNPRQVMTEVFGSKLLGGSNLMVMSFLYFFNRCNRSHSMPNQLESLKIAERSGMKGPRLIWAMTLAVGVGTVVALVSYLQVLYKYGAVARCRGWIGQCGWESFNPLQTWMQYSTDPNWSSIGFIFGGFGFVILLTFLRKIFFWWPLHPSGYVLAGASWGGMIYFWFPVLLTWAIKSLVLKHGGLGTYRKTAPLFLGLVLGDYTLWFLWSIISVVFNVPISAAY